MDDLLAIHSNRAVTMTALLDRITLESITITLPKFSPDCYIVL